MQTHYISYRKRLWQPRRAIRLEFAIPAATKQEARLIAEKEAADLKGYRYEGVN